LDSDTAALLTSHAHQAFCHHDGPATAVHNGVFPSCITVYIHISQFDSGLIIQHFHGVTEVCGLEGQILQLDMAKGLNLGLKNDFGWVAFTHNSKLVHKNRFNLIVAFAYDDDVMWFCLLQCFHESHAKPTMRYPDSCHALAPSLCTLRHNDATSGKEVSAYYLRIYTEQCPGFETRGIELSSLTPRRG